MSGKYKSNDDFETGDFRKDWDRTSKENYENNMQIVRRFEMIANNKGCTAAQLCLAWLLAQADNVFLIPGFVFNMENTVLS